MQLALAVKLFVFWLLAVAVPVSADPARTSDFAGSSHPLPDVDVNGDGITAFISRTNGKDPRFGRYTGTVFSESGEVTGLCGPTAVFFGYTMFVATVEYETGDALFLGLGAGDPGGTCFDFVEGVLDTDLILSVTGGTGRFANATGTLRNRTRGTQLLTDAAGEPVFVGFSGSLSGNVELNCAGCQSSAP